MQIIGNPCRTNLLHRRLHYHTRHHRLRRQILSLPLQKTAASSRARRYTSSGIQTRTGLHRIRIGQE